MILRLPSKDKWIEMVKFKENWNKVDEKCSHCNNVTKKVVGMNKQNLKRLFAKPTLQDLIIFIMLSACLFLTWAYYNEVSQYQAIVKNPGEFCTIYSNQLSQMNNQKIDMDNLIVTQENIDLFNLDISFEKNG